MSTEIYKSRKIHYFKAGKPEQPPFITLPGEIVGEPVPNAITIQPFGHTLPLAMIVRDGEEKLLSVSYGTITRLAGNCSGIV